MSSTQKPPRGRKSPNQQQKNQSAQQNSNHSNPSQASIPSKPQSSPTPQQGNAPPKEPGMFQRVAETAAGVAVGSAIGNCLFGSGSSSDSKSTPTSGSDKPENVCEKEKTNFIRCTENENDLAKCEELQKEYKGCRIKYSLP